MLLRFRAALRASTALLGLCIASCAASGADATDPHVSKGMARVAADSVAPRGETGRFLAPLDTVDSWVEVDPAAVNLEVERAWTVGLEWPRLAMEVALRAVGPVDAGKVRLDLVREGVEGPTASLVITRLGLADDSIGGVRDDIDLALQLDGSWRVVTHWRSYFCPRGPGRGAWMAGPCH